MKIDGIEYRVLLFINKSDQTEEELLFADFYEMNTFILEHKDFPEYKDCHVEYTLTECSDDGVCEAFSWRQPMKFEIFSEERIRKESEDQKEWLAEITKDAAAMDAWMKNINYDPRPKDYLKKTPKLKTYTYVCPFCIREINDCRCDIYPYYLVQIDTIILPVIRELNTKGYKTTGCCAGHPEEESFISIYICFDKNYDFDWPLPKNAHYYKGRHCLRMDPPPECEDLLDFQQKAIWELNDWAEMLSDLYDDDSYLFEE